MGEVIKFHPGFAHGARVLLPNFRSHVAGPSSGIVRLRVRGLALKLGPPLSGGASLKPSYSRCVDRSVLLVLFEEGHGDPLCGLTR